MKMTHARRGLWAAGLASLTSVLLPGGLAVADDDVQQLRDMVELLRSEVDVLRAERESDWLTEHRAEEIRELVQDVLADADTRASLQGTSINAGYDGGFFIQSSDDSFKLKVGGQLQVRWDFNHRKGNDSQQTNAYGFEVRRFKLKFSGHILDPSWTYKMSIVNTRNSRVGGSAGFYSEDAWIQKKFENDMYIKVGQFKAPYLREELVSSSAQLTVERSMVNTAFTYGWTQGLELGWNNDWLSVKGMYNDGPLSLNGQAFSAGENSLTARAELKLAGDWQMFRSLSGYGNSEFGAMIGAAVEWYNFDSPGNAFEYGNIDGRNNIGYTVDLSVGGSGWTAFTYFVWGNGANHAAIYDEPSLDSWGWVVQGGIMPVEDVELFARYEVGDIEDYRGSLTLPGETGHNSTLTLGANWWPTGTKHIKISADFGYAFSNLANGDGANTNPANPNTNPGSADWVSSGTGWAGDYDNNDGQILIRAQMQLLF
ncbi:MAG: OprO/OprP family phosphate-selective porin [Phycisphaerales bacterium]|nr:OprO/OprP family phosphate-selective porin [Phycisphaerales bacterium]